MTREAPQQRVASIAAGDRLIAMVGGLRARALHASPLQRVLLSFGAGAISVLALAPFFLWPVLFLTLPLLVWLIDAAGDESPQDAAKRSRSRVLRRAGLTGWLFGFGYFVFGLFWVGEAFLVEAEKFAWLLPFAVTLLPAGLALFFAAAAAVARRFWGGGLARVVMLAVALFFAEWLRGHILTGLPWNVLGYALTPPGVLMQSASLLGIYGLTLVAVIVAAAPLVALADAAGSTSPFRIRRAFGGALLSFAILGALAGFGAWRLAGATEATVPGVRLRIVQPSVPQREKWQQAKQREIFDLHLDLSRRDPAGRIDDLAGITHVVWPEAAMPFLPLDSPDALGEIGAMLPDGAFLITGALRAERPVNDSVLHGAAAAVRPAIYNSLIVLNGGGGLHAVYDKIHLVPFGEYLPMQGLLEAIGLQQLTRLRGGFAAGRSPRPLLDVPGLPPLLGLVCYEAIFPGAVVQGSERPALIVNVTNDGWFGRTTGPQQHFHAARVRAVEEGVPIVRAANNGVSALIDPYGRVRGQLDIDVRGTSDSLLPVAIEAPPYARFGDAASFLLAACVLAALFVVAQPRHT